MTIENPDNLPPYWKELKYRTVGGTHVFKGPPPKYELVLSAERTHATLKENLCRLAMFKAQHITDAHGVNTDIVRYR